MYIYAYMSCVNNEVLVTITQYESKQVIMDEDIFIIADVSKFPLVQTTKPFPRSRQ